jgi:hypothetical protein
LRKTRYWHTYKNKPKNIFLSNEWWLKLTWNFETQCRVRAKRVIYLIKRRGPREFWLTFRFKENNEDEYKFILGKRFYFRKMKNLTN